MVPVREKVLRQMASRVKLPRSRLSSCFANEVPMASTSTSSGMLAVGNVHRRMERTLVSGATVILPEGFCGDEDREHCLQGCGYLFRLLSESCN